MIQLSGASVVTPDAVLDSATLVIDQDRIVELVARGERARSGGRRLHLDGHVVVPGFVDVHVHGVEGVDTLDGGDAVARIARVLPRYGVTAFCPTSIACPPADLRELLSGVRRARLEPAEAAARVLPAHLESNFINPDYKGAQPAACLRLPGSTALEGGFSAHDIRAEIAAGRAEVGIVTLAPELDGALDLVRDLVSHGHRVSLGHSGATYEQAIAGIEAGARHATHLFNRMTPFAHRAPGLTGAVLERREVFAEVICDGVHIHASAIRLALAAKGPERIMAITDGTAGAGLARGARATLGGRAITVGDAAYLEDGTLAGSVLTMDGAFRTLVGAGVGLQAAVRMCSTTPARALGLAGAGAITPGALADLVVLDANLRVVHTLISGRLV